jgi:short-subunit dehydrogenase
MAGAASSCRNRRKHHRMEESSPTPSEQRALETRGGESRPIVADPVSTDGDPGKAFSTYRCRAVITGASGGLGAEFARQLAGKATCLVLAARSADKLQQLAAELIRLRPTLRIETVACDLSTEEGRALLWTQVDALELPPNLLINNAGHGDYGDFVQATEARIESQIALNITALTMITHAFLKRVNATAATPAAVLNVSSLAASTPLPDLIVYAATKSYVTSFSEALAIEWKERHVQVLAVCPGPTPTNFSATARRADGEDTDRSGQDLLKMPPQKVVSIALQSLERGWRRVHPGVMVAISAFLFEKMPRGLLRAILAARYRRSRRAA